MESFGHRRRGRKMSFSRDVVIVGGCGRVGLPLGLVLADAGLSVTLYDLDANAVDRVRAGKMPFWERGADELLERLIATDRLDATTDPSVGRRGRARRARRRHAGRRAPQPRPEVRAASRSRACSTSSATASTSCCAAPCTRASPRWSRSCSRRRGATIDVSFCPERIAEGKALEELRTLPQIVSARTEHAVRRAETLFAHDRAVDRAPRRRGSRARQALHEHVALHQVRGREPAVHDRQRLRPRLRPHPRRAQAGLPARWPACPGPGLAAGPCLLKDTMQLAAFNNNNFTLGHASMMINEGLPDVHGRRKLEHEYDLSDDDRRHPRHGVQGRVRRHPFEPELQAQAAAAVPRRRACSAPTRTRTTTSSSGRSTTCSPSPTCS